MEVMHSTESRSSAHPIALLQFPATRNEIFKRAKNPKCRVGFLSSLRSPSLFIGRHLQCSSRHLRPSASYSVSSHEHRWKSYASNNLDGSKEPQSTNKYSIFDEHQLEEELQKAVSAEDYKQAAKLRDELRILQEDNRAGVLSANRKFYKAFENGDLSAMRTIWSKGNNVHCIHPGAGCISGHAFVIESWEFMLGPDADLPLQIELQNVEVHTRENIGFVSCIELVRTSGSSWGKQVATNIFEKVDGNWYICVHHASHISM
eukprot:TRINITY_DN13860_c0_g1_i1.p1 TRINITY_DN13860_c0_g1~~TRINITY_DN13860_c0_g1_i1.p1  ORF type:complete len:261 (-),score=32.55 TRINITY_DN13860_c0_g1_i1:45-827(-)